MLICRWYTHESKKTVVSTDDCDFYIIMMLPRARGGRAGGQAGWRRRREIGMRTAAAVRAAQAEVEKHDRGNDHIITVSQDSRDDAAALAHSTECVQNLRRTCA